VSDTIRCSSCGAINPAEAEWCNQCFVRFKAPPPPPAAEPEAPLETREPAEAAPAPATTEATRRGAFSAAGERVTWTCSRCGSENDIDTQICSTCGATLADLLRPEPAERPARDPGTTTLISLAFPGAGHAYLGLWGQALARGIVSAWVIAVALYTAVVGGQGAAGAIPAVFGLAAFALWIVAAHDAYREANGERGAVLLKPRYFLYVVLGLLLVLLGLIVIGSLGATRPDELS
jgi:ribosomal protein L40E